MTTVSSRAHITIDLYIFYFQFIIFIQLRVQFEMHEIKNKTLYSRMVTVQNPVIYLLMRTHTIYTESSVYGFCLFLCVENERTNFLLEKVG